MKARILFTLALFGLSYGAVPMVKIITISNYPACPMPITIIIIIIISFMINMMIMIIIGSSPWTRCLSHPRVCRRCCLHHPGFQNPHEMVAIIVLMMFLSQWTLRPIPARISTGLPAEAGWWASSSSSSLSSSSSSSPTSIGIIAKGWYKPGFQRNPRRYVQMGSVLRAERPSQQCLEKWDLSVNSDIHPNQRL